MQLALRRGHLRIWTLLAVLFAALLGAVLLKEAFGFQRGAGTLLILGGVAALRLA